MEKLNTFLDSNILLLYYKGDSRLTKLFSEQILKRVNYIINSIVFQELILLNKRIRDIINFNEISKQVKIQDYYGEKVDFKKLQHLRNKKLHSSDILLLRSAIYFKCRIFLTLDNDLLRLEIFDGLEILSPLKFFQKLGVKL